jgi:hypothetical protein
MGQVDFAIESLDVDASGKMYAHEKLTGRVIERRAEWSGWVPLPTYLPMPPALARRWDTRGAVYSSAGVIYRLDNGSSEWALVPGSLGKNFVTADPDGNLFATAPSSVVMLKGTSEWVAAPPVTRVDAMGRAYSGTARLDGLSQVNDDQLLGKRVLFDANGDIVELIEDGTISTIRWRKFASAESKTLATFASRPGLELLGCGLEGTCLLVRGDVDVFEARGEGLRQVGSTRVTSTGEALNFAGYRFSVGPEGRLFLFDVSGQTTAFSRMFKLVPGTAPWPGESR